MDIEGDFRDYNQTSRALFYYDLLEGCDVLVDPNHYIIKSYNDRTKVITEEIKIARVRDRFIEEGGIEKKVENGKTRILSKGRLNIRIETAIIHEVDIPLNLVGRLYTKRRSGAAKEIMSYAKQYLKTDNESFEESDELYEEFYGEDVKLWEEEDEDEDDEDEDDADYWKRTDKGRNSEED
jgi:hypothetical protein